MPAWLERIAMSASDQGSDWQKKLKMLYIFMEYADNGDLYEFIEDIKKENKGKIP